MKRCWANKLDNCTDKISREHIISQGVFDGEIIEISGLSWCKDKPKRIGLSSLISKILCKKHNSQLSIVDEEAAVAFETFREFDRITEVRKNLQTDNPNVLNYYIDGKLFERWFLKTLINICNDSELPIGSDSKKIGKPSKRLVEVAFGKENFKKQAGLYFIVKEGDKILSGEYVACAPLKKPDEYLAGGIFKIKGYQFLLFLSPKGPPSDTTGLKFGEEDLSGSRQIYHVETFKDELNGQISQKIIFEW